MKNRLGSALETAVLCLLLEGTLQAATLPESDPLCSLQDTTAIHKVALGMTPSYFSKVYSSRKLACVISDGENYLVDLNTGKRTLVPGTYDPVPTPDEKFLTSIKRSDTLHLYLTSEIMKQNPGDQRRPGWSSSNFESGWAYQSIGLLSQDPAGKERIYRVLVDDDSGGFQIRNYEFTFKSDDDKEPTLHEGDWVKLCTNIDSLLKLPMISKDGKMLSAYDVRAERTKIFEISAAGECSLKQTLPLQSGKADFSFDGKQVAFHMDTSNNRNESGWFKFASPNTRRNVFVWDLKKKELTRVTNNTRGNSYFPTFRRDGTIGYIEQVPSETPGQDPTYNYVLANPKKGRTLPEHLANPGCTSDQEQIAELAAIGDLWAVLCADWAKGLSAEDASLLPLALDPDQCKELVEKHWAGLKNDIATQVGQVPAVGDGELLNAEELLKELPASALQAACPKKKLATSRPTRQGSSPSPEPTVTQKMTPMELLHSRCTECHSGDNPRGGVGLDVEKLSDLPTDLRKKMAELIRDGDMPPGGLPSSSEKNTLRKLLLSGE